MTAGHAALRGSPAQNRAFDNALEYRERLGDFGRWPAPAADARGMFASLRSLPRCAQEVEAAGKAVEVAALWDWLLNDLA